MGENCRLQDWVLAGEFPEFQASLWRLFRTMNASLQLPASLFFDIWELNVYVCLPLRGAGKRHWLMLVNTLRTQNRSLSSTCICERRWVLFYGNATTCASWCTTELFGIFIVFCFAGSVLQSFPLRGYCLVQFEIESWWKLLLLMLLSGKLWFGGSCGQTCMGVKRNRKFTVIHNFVKVSSRRKTLTSVFAIGEEILLKY